MLGMEAHGKRTWSHCPSSVLSPRADATHSPSCFPLRDDFDLGTELQVLRGTRLANGMEEFGEHHR